MRYEVRVTAYVESLDQDDLAREIAARFGGSWDTEELPGDRLGGPLGVYKEPPPVADIEAWLKLLGVEEGWIEVDEIKRSSISW